MKKFITNKITIYILGFLFLIGLWFILSLTLDKNSMIFPNPIVTFGRMFELLEKGQTYGYLGFSIVRLLIGFVISFIVAFLLGILVNNNNHLYRFFTPLMTFFKAAPTATFVFLFIILISAKNAPIFVVFTVTMPILYESIVGALRNTDENVIAAARIDGASRLKQIMKVQLPIGLPIISVGITSTFAMAFKIEIMAEIITGFTNGGIGSMIHNSQLINPTDLTDMFAYSLMAIILVLLITILSSILKQKSIIPVKKKLSSRE